MNLNKYFIKEKRSNIQILSLGYFIGNEEYDLKISKEIPEND